ncbi:GTPase slip-gc [Fusarium longipes]|uniref:GTPase slip-gc n=1 Tax=Fusarium longipes TaxID=694270 RepID=A0A395RVJ0_9HYPO|nr:GTPase slip-gc [Fusarium longipes]
MKIKLRWMSRATVKRERSPDLDHESDAPNPKRQANGTAGVARAPLQFPWRTCDDLEDAERLKIKEEAVFQAETYCDQIRAALGSVSTIPRDSPEATMMGRRNVKLWCEQYDAVCTKHQGREILVGVEGPTGAGKSSFLNSLLGIPELFPSGQESAATAVIGKVSWNWVDTPGREFRAKVVFRKKDEIADEIKSFLKEINHFSDLKEGRLDDHFDDEDDKADAISISKTTIDREIPRLKAAWGMKRGQLFQLAKQCPGELSYEDAVLTIFRKNSTATNFLHSGEIEFDRSTAETLSEAIKPFLDSSSNTHGGTNKFSAWPLVKSVHIYVEAEILKPGITLVDLPGCGDAVESRSEVTTKISHTLDVRMVVSPIIRAADEKQGRALMQNGFDEAQMRIRGKLDGRGFCVIASKMDDMNVDSYIHQCDELAHDTNVIQKLDKRKALMDEQKKLEAMRRDLSTAKKQAESRQKRASKLYDNTRKKLNIDPNASDPRLLTLRAQRDVQDNALIDAYRRLDECQLRESQIVTEMKYTEDWIYHRAIQTRNTRVIEQLRTNFASRQAQIDHDDAPERSQIDTEYVLPILPVSTTAFWRLESKQGHMSGFPDHTYTGIPAVEQWIHRATLTKREKHLDEALMGYQNLMTMMKIYSAENSQNLETNFTRLQVEAALADTHDSFTKSMGSKLSETCSEINKLDPIAQGHKAKKKFLQEAPGIVQRWAYKYPDHDGNVEKLHYATHDAILRRDGSLYTSPSSGITYTWNENLVAPIIEALSRDWDRKMNRQLPLIQRPMFLDYSRLFTEYLNALQCVINEKVPTLADQFSNLRPILESSQRATEMQIGEVLGTLSEKAAMVTHDAVKYLKGEIKPIFETALNITGTGCFALRKETIRTKIKNDANLICDKMINRLVDGVAERKAEVPAQLKIVAAKGPRIVQEKLSCLVNNLVENCSADPAMNAKKTRLQNEVRVHIEAWESSWAEERNYEDHILDLDLDIPDSIPEPDPEEDSHDEAMGDGLDDDDGRY